MSIRLIRTGMDPILRQVAKPVTKITPVIEKLLDDMVATMVDANGVGLAASQIGVLKRVIVMDVGEGLVEMVNPVILSKEGKQIDTEGCLSLPGIQGDVERALTVTVRGSNRQGEEVTLEATGLFARCVQHEVDHLDGVLFTDYLQPHQIVQVLQKESGGR